MRTTPAETQAAGGKCPGLREDADDRRAAPGRPAGRPARGLPRARGGRVHLVRAAAGDPGRDRRRRPEVQVRHRPGHRAGGAVRARAVHPRRRAADDLAAGAPSIVAEAIGRLRRGDVRREAGYDGVYGTIRLFDPGELAGAALFDLPRASRKPRGRGGQRSATRPAPRAGRGTSAGRVRRTAGSAGPRSGRVGCALTRCPGPRAARDRHPRRRPAAGGGGPGAGKTRVLTHAIAHRIGNGLPPERCLAVTFTRRARDELRERLAALLGAETADQVTVATFHSLGLLILRDLGLEDRVDLDDPDGFDAVAHAPAGAARATIRRSRPGTGPGGRTCSSTSTRTWTSSSTGCCGC